jgi:hypothetical protein
MAPISLPRTLRISSGGRLSMRRPASLTSPRAMRPGGSSSAGQRLSGARFTDDAEHLPGGDRERDVVDGEQRAAPRRKLDPQAADLEQRFSHAHDYMPGLQPPIGSA